MLETWTEVVKNNSLFESEKVGKASDLSFYTMSYSN